MTIPTDAYYLIDRFLRNNLGDDDYAEYSAALEAVCQPQAVAGGEPIGYLYCGGSYGDELADWEIVADQVQCDKLNEHHGALGQEAKLPLYTAQPPQAVREPLTDAQIARIARSVLEAPAADGVPLAWTLAVGIARAIEAAHGIKGGQHGAE